jgi:hypothetical protein
MSFSKPQHSRKAKVVERCIGQCDIFDPYSHDFLHCNQCVILSQSCFIKNCPCEGKGKLISTNNKTLFSHQMLEHNKSIRVYSSRKGQAALRVGRLFNEFNQRMSKNLNGNMISDAFVNIGGIHKVNGVGTNKVNSINYTNYINKANANSANFTNKANSATANNNNGNIHNKANNTINNTNNTTNFTTNNTNIINNNNDINKTSIVMIQILVKQNKKIDNDIKLESTMSLNEEGTNEIKMEEEDDDDEEYINNDDDDDDDYEEMKKVPSRKRSRSEVDELAPNTKRICQELIITDDLFGDDDDTNGDNDDYFDEFLEIGGNANDERMASPGVDSCDPDFTVALSDDKLDQLFGSIAGDYHNTVNDDDDDHYYHNVGVDDFHDFGEFGEFGDPLPGFTL